MAEANGTAVAYLGIDVGKRSHSACALDAGGEVVFRADLENRPADVDRLLERAGAGALVVVDQKRNIGALVLARAFAHGNPCAYLPGYAERQARGWQVALLAEFGSAAGCSAAGWRRFSAAARRAGAPAAGARALWEAMLASSGSGRALPAGEDVAVRMLAREIAALDADVAELEGLVADSLAGDEVYECLLTVPGIGPKTAAALVTSVDISMFRGHGELASYCGVAPADSRSGTSVRSTSPQRGGNKQLKNLLIFSCNSLIGTDNRFGRYYDECRARGMRHNKALKAVARKRLKVVYAVMRDAVPYSA